MINVTCLLTEHTKFKHKMTELKEAVICNHKQRSRYVTFNNGQDNRDVRTKIEVLENTENQLEPRTHSELPTQKQ